MTTTRRVRRMGVRGEKRVRGGEISPRRAALGRLLKVLGAVAGGLLLRARKIQSVHGRDQIGE
ncbi:hypothetical protein V6Z12_D09G200300 [Gossypium hirsutum]